MNIIIYVSAIVVHEPGQDRKIAALSEFAMCADIFICKRGVTYGFYE